MEIVTLLCKFTDELYKPRELASFWVTSVHRVLGKWSSMG